MKRSIATIGYEGATLASFVAALERASIDVLVDVREVALSRKRGFSKSHLAEALDAVGIDYIHLRSLGDPKEGREAARAGKHSQFQRIFLKHLATASAQMQLAEAAEIVAEQRACLMCYELDHTKCHRSIVAGHLSTMTGLPVTPLTAQADAEEQVVA